MTEPAISRPSGRATLAGLVYSASLLVVVALCPPAGLRAQSPDPAPAGPPPPGRYYALSSAADAMRPATSDSVRAIEPVRLRSGKVVLAGVAYVPRTMGAPEARQPAVVLLSGSGAHSRYNRFHGYPMYGELAEALVRRGFVVLTYDKRGVGQSTGSWQRQSFDEQADDAQAALRWLAARPDVDPRRIGVLGHSQGAWIAQLVAARAPDSVAFAVLLAGPAMSVKEQIVLDEHNERVRTGAVPSTAEPSRRLRWGLGALGAVAPACRLVRASYLCWVVNHDPADALARMRAPTLSVFGALDGVVPAAENVPLLRAGLARAGAPEPTVVVLPGLNHNLFPARTGSRAEWSTLPPGFGVGVLDTLGSWMTARAAP